MLPRKESEISKENLSEKFEEFFFTYRNLILLVLTGIFLIGIGVFVYKKNLFSEEKIVIMDNEEDQKGEIVVEIAGKIEKPGVYKLESGSRIEDLIIVCGGFSKDADRKWLEKSLNRAAKLTDGQKIYIPSVEEHSDVLSAKDGGGYQNVSANSGGQGSGFIDINKGTQKELESLYGIGPVYAQSIIEQRPYSNIEELVSKKVIPQKTFEKIKDKITVY